MTPSQKTNAQNTEKRLELLYTLEAWFEIPVMILGVIWLILLFIDLLQGLSPFLDYMVYAIWVIFILDFFIRFLIAPRKIEYLKDNWITELSLLAPAVRILGIFRFAKFLRFARFSGSIQLMKIFGSLYRGMIVIRAGFSRHGLGYLIAFTILVTLIGAAGMLRFEYQVDDPNGIHSYGEAIWWTAMIMTTVGSTYWPRTMEGRILCFFLALYAFGIFGYITARLAAFIIGRDAESDTSHIPDAAAIKVLHVKVNDLDDKLNTLLTYTAPQDRTGAKEIPNKQAHYGKKRQTVHRPSGTQLESSGREPS